jgi:hypothetical protein
VNELDINTDLISGRGFHEANTFLESLILLDERGNRKGGKDDATSKPGTRSVLESPIAFKRRKLSEEGPHSLAARAKPSSSILL